LLTFPFISIIYIHYTAKAKLLPVTSYSPVKVSWATLA